MARMHSRAKGKSSSKKPIKKIPAWAPYKEKEVEKLVVKYAKAGRTSSEIGLILRDVHGVNSVKALTSKNITKLLQENHLHKELPEDMISLIKRLISIRQHLEKNKHDQTAKRGLGLTLSKINRLIKYYHHQERLPVGWKLDMNRLKMYVG